MSHTNTTTNYGLPQFLSSDKPAWMADINVAFADIDAQMKTNADAASAAQTTANDAVLNGAPGYSNLSTYAVGDVVNYLGRVYKCDIAVTTPEAFDNAKWSYYRLSDASSQLDVIDSEIGNTDISGIGDGTITGAINALDDNFTDLIDGTSEPVTQHSQIQRHTRLQIAGEIPTAGNIVTLFNALNTTGSYIVDFRSTGEETIRSTGLFSIVNSSYGAGIIVSYYNDRFYKVVNSNGSVTITPM